MRALGFPLMVVVITAAGCAYPEYSVNESPGPVQLDDPPDPESCNLLSTVFQNAVLSLSSTPPFDLDLEAAKPTPMVPVRGGYCIDRTEVTWEQYDAWLLLVDMPGLEPEQPAECSTNDDLWPSMDCPAPTDLRHPVVCVDWCDAYAYCQAVGKELCGHIDGGPNDFEAFADPAASQWHNACSSGGRDNYPYGDEFDADTCYTTSAPVGSLGGTTRLVGGRSGCQSSEPDYEGVFDLSGNVDEWEDSCSPSQGCRTRGGAAFYWTSDGAAAANRCDASRYYRPDQQLDYVGFRCCYTPAS